MQPTAVRGADDHRDRLSQSVVMLGGHIDDLVKRTRDEIGELHLHHRTHPHQGRADGRADKPRLR